MNIYRFKVKLHADKGYITMFYDEDRETVIKAMGEYDKKNGFTYYEGKYRFTCADLVITEETPKGEILSETPYIKLFDTFTGKRLKQ
jgi:hypothetical protein